MWKTASASPPSGGRPRLVADHTHTTNPAQRPQGGDLFLFTHLLVEVSVLFIYSFVIMLSCLSAAATLPRPPPRKVARAFANPVLRLLPDAHRLASLRGRPPGRAVATPVAREAANRAASTAPRRRAATVGPRTRFLRPAPESWRSCAGW